MAGKRRDFGNVRQCESGKWQASYPNPNGPGRVNAPQTFERKSDANKWLANVRADLTRGVLQQPRANKETFAAYAEKWLTDRPKPLARTTMEDHRRSLRLHILPSFGKLPIGEISSKQVREWYAKLGRQGKPAAQVKAYKLMHAIMRTAADEEEIPANPCKIKGAQTVKSKELTVVNAADVDALAAHVPARYRAMVLVEMYAHLRHGELIGLRRCDIDLKDNAIKIRSQLQYVGCEWVRVPPKSEAGKRTIHLPKPIMKELAKHLLQFTDGDPEAPVFVGEQGKPVARQTYNRNLKSAGEQIGRTDLHSHLLRHSGLTLAAQKGATTKELMARGGHTKVDVAMRYQHAVAERDKALADRLLAS